MRWTAWITVVAVLLAAPSAQADGPVLPPDVKVIHPLPRVDVVGTLEYTLKPGTEGVCMGAQEFRWELATLAGRDYYDPRLKGILVGHWRVVVGRSRQGFMVTSEFMEIGTTVGVPEKAESQGTDRMACYRALQHTAVRMHLDFTEWEWALGRQAEEAARARKLPAAPSCRSPKPESTADAVPLPCPESPYALWPTEWPLPPPEKPKPDPPAPPEPWPFALRFGAMVWPELIATGWGSVGFAVDAGIRYRWASVNVEAHGDPPSGSQTFPSGVTVSFTRISGALLLCGHWGWLTGCGVGDVGRFIFPDHAVVLPPSTFYSAAGVRTKLEFPVAPPRVFLSVGLDVRAPIHPASYTFGGATIFQAAGPSVGLGLGLVAELPL